MCVCVSVFAVTEPILGEKKKPLDFIFSGIFTPNYFFTIPFEYNEEKNAGTKS